MEYLNLRSDKVGIGTLAIIWNGRGRSIDELDIHMNKLSLRLSLCCKFDFQMSESDFKAVSEVEIDAGVFKYVLIRLYRFA